MTDPNSELSEIHASCVDDVLRIHYDRARPTPDDRFEIALADIPDTTRKKSPVRVKNNRLKNRILLVKEADCGETVVVYTNETTVMYYRHDNPLMHPLSRLLEIQTKATRIKLSPKGLKLAYRCLIVNKYDIPVTGSYLTLEGGYSQAQAYPVYKQKPSRSVFRKQVFTTFLPMAELLDGEPLINARFQVAVDIQGQWTYKNIQKLSRGGKSSRWYYAPIAQTRSGDYAVHMRRTAHGGLNLVRRHLEPVEKTPAFRFYESKPVSFLMYHTAHLVRRFSNTPVNIYFEKLASKAEEGAFEVFQKARNAAGARNFFIIAKDAADYARLKDEADVVPKFSLKSYWLTYRANNIIATEAPAHVNVLRSNNRYVRSAPFSQRFVLLQHGVTYLKAHSQKSAFIKGHEAEAADVIVGGRKERDTIADMFALNEERIFNTGLPIFDKLEYNHITPDSADIVTIMLTWKPYDEHFQDFTQSSYYQTVVELFEALKQFMPAENIRIQAHPKFVPHLNGTSIRDAVWQGSVSDLLNQTKLLITDYSSVCYNVFYQGGSVLFYQPDLERYERENGQLIPTSEEYIGGRTFTIGQLTQTLHDCIQNGAIDLSRLRTDQHVNEYRQINEFSDGRNVERIVSRLQQLRLLGAPQSPESQIGSERLKSLRE